MAEIWIDPDWYADQKSTDPLPSPGLPIVVPLHFVGDTPVIVMTDTNLPGIGTFTVRLLFSGDRYAGTWQHGEVGGQMSGRIAPTPVAP